MRRLWTAAFLTAMSCRPGTSDWDSVKAKIRLEFPEVEQISTDELKAQLDSPRPILLDVRTEEETFDVVTAPEDFTAVRDALAAAGIPYLSAEVTMIPRSTVRLEGKEAQQMLRLMDALEDHDDVQNVYANFDIPESVMASLA